MNHPFITFSLLLSNAHHSKANGFQAFACSSSSTSRKVFFTADGLDNLIVKIHGGVVDTNLINAGVFVQNRPAIPAKSTKRYAGRLRIICEHPNTFLRPNLFFKGDVDLTANLTGDSLREYVVDFFSTASSSSSSSSLLTSSKDLAGVYDCSWTEMPSSGNAVVVVPPAPRTSIDAVLYEDQIECGIGADIAGVNITTKLDHGVSLADYRLVCRLRWTGSDNGNLKLHWRGMDDLLEDVEGTVDHTADVDGTLMSAIVLKEVIVTKTLSFQCVVGDEETFEGRKPKACAVKFNPVTRGLSASAGKGGAEDVEYLKPDTRGKKMTK